MLTPTALKRSSKRKWLQEAVRLRLYAHGNFAVIKERERNVEDKMKFCDKEIETSIKLADGDWAFGKASIEFVVDFEARSYGIKSTYVTVEAVRAYWTEDIEDKETDFELVFLRHSGATLFQNGSVLWSNLEPLKWEQETNLDNTNGAVVVDEIEIDLRAKEIEVKLI